MTGVPRFPGAVGLTGLDVYDWPDDAGTAGGTPHVHLVCAEAYVVVRGRGRVQAISGTGEREVRLAEGDVVWYEPGTVHRSVDDGGLRVVVVMQNSGLPEAGDAVMTFPEEDLVSPEAYAAAASLGERPDATAARARRDRALEGFAPLVDAARSGDPEPYRAFLAAAAAIVRPRLPTWRSTVEDGPLAAARSSLARIDELERGDTAPLAEAVLARVPAPASRTFGMCGLLHAYDPLRREAEISAGS